MNVVLYSTGCPKCNILKKKLFDKKVNYIENNNVDEMTDLGIEQAPVLSVNGVLMEFGKAIEWVNEME